MKKKSFKFFLLAGTVVVWGSIIYRIVTAVSGQGPANTYVAPPSPARISMTLPQKYILLMDYPDPFLKDEVTDTLPAVQSAPVVAPPPPPPIDVSFVQYAGMISNLDAPKKVALVIIHGQDKMVQQGEVVDEVKIKELKKDEIKVVYKGKMFVVKKT